MFRVFLFALLSFSAGGLCHFAMAPYNFAIVLFLGIPALFYALQRADGKLQTFIFAWLFGFGYFIFGLSWIANALLVPTNSDFEWAYPLAVAGLPALLAFFPAICITFITKRFDLEHISGWYAFVFALVLSEILRGFLFTGFPWNNFAYTWVKVLPMAQLVSVGGLYFLTIPTIFWAATPALIFLHKRGTQAITTMMISVITLTSVFYWGFQRMETEPLFGMNEVAVHLIQPNIKQEDKWNPNLMQDHFSKLVTLSQKAVDSQKNKNMQLIIWPETASVRSILFKEENRQKLRKLLPKDAKNYLMTGILYARKENGKNAYYNSLSLFGPNHELMNIYDKHHLVPFGEYIPFNQYIPLDPVVNFSGFKAGSGPKKMPITKSFSVSPLICYEIIFPGKMLPYAKRNKTNMIVNVTNDAWYGNSAGPRQHLVQAQFRAIETGLPVARVANTGISAMIAPNGSIATSMSYGRSGYKSYPLLLPLQNETYFTKFRHKFTVALFFILATGMYFFRKDH